MFPHVLGRRTGPTSPGHAVVPEPPYRAFLRRGEFGSPRFRGGFAAHLWPGRRAFIMDFAHKSRSNRLHFWCYRTGKKDDDMRCLFGVLIAAALLVPAEAMTTRIDERASAEAVQSWIFTYRA